MIINLKMYYYVFFIPNKSYDFNHITLYFIYTIMKVI